MTTAPAPWQIDLARLEGALPFLTETQSICLARRSLRRLWSLHVRDYPFEGYGLSYDPGLDADELLRTSYTGERSEFLSWIIRRGPLPLAQAAKTALSAKGAPEVFSAAFADADRALDLLDTLLPTDDPLAALTMLVDRLSREEPGFLEGESEDYVVAGISYTRAAGRGSAWAASLAVAMRPHLLGLGNAPLALAGLTRRGAFRPLREDPVMDIVADSLAAALAAVRRDVETCRMAEAVVRDNLAEQYRSSRARDMWYMLTGLGPLTRAEVARALGVTKRTASQGAAALESAGILPPQDRYLALAPTRPFAAPLG